MQNVARGMSTYSIGCVCIAGGVLDGDDALVGGLVRERRAGDEVADRVDALAADVRSAPSTSIRPLSSSFDAGVVEAEALDVGAAAGGDDEPVGLALLAAVGERDARRRRVSTFSTSVSVWTSMPCFLKPRSASFEMSASSVGSTRSSASNSMHLGAEARVGGGDLRARRAGADDGERARAARSAPTPPRCRSRGRRTCVPGIGRLTEPVARITRLASPRTRSVADARPLPSPVSRADALDHVDLVLLEQAARRRR